MQFHFYLRRSIVYVPTVAQRETGAYTEVEPVAVVPVANTEGLHRAFEDTIARKNTIVPRPKGKWPPPLLPKYAGVKTWSAFARDTSTWSIEETDGVYQIIGYRMHPKGYWEQDSDQKTPFPQGTKINDVINRMIAILQAAARP